MDQRLITLEGATHGTSITALNTAIGMPYTGTAIKTRLTTNEGNIATNTANLATLTASNTANATNITTNTNSINTLNTKVTSLETAVGMPYVGDTVAARLLSLEGRATALELKAGYFVGQGMVRVADVGGGSGT